MEGRVRKGREGSERNEGRGGKGRERMDGKESETIDSDGKGREGGTEEWGGEGKGREGEEGGERQGQLGGAFRQIKIYHYTPGRRLSVRNVLWLNGAS